MGRNLGSGVRSGVTDVAVVGMRYNHRFPRRGATSARQFRKFREFCDTPVSGGCGARGPEHGWISRMGRKAKGDRHTIIASMPSEAAELVRSERPGWGATSATTSGGRSRTTSTSLVSCRSARSPITLTRYQHLVAA